jgi:hypothetical protein
MKVEKKQKSFYILDFLLEVIIKNMAIWKNILWNLANLGHFLYEKSFAYV